MKRQEQDNRFHKLWQDIEAESMGRQHGSNEVDESTIERHEFNLLAEKLERYTVAAPSIEQTQALMAVLSPIITDVSRLEHTNAEFTHHQQTNTSLWKRFADLSLQQVRLFSWIFWVISAVIIGAGAIMTPLFHKELINPFIAVAPIVAGIGMFYALRSYRTPMGELEATFPVSKSEIMMGRLGVILVYNIGIALLASLMLNFLGLTGSLLLFIISWLVPLCFSTFLTLFAMLMFGTLPGASITLAVLGTQIIMRDVLGPFYLLSDLGYQYWEISKLIGIGVTIVMALYIFRVLLKQDKGAFSDVDPA